MTAFVLGNGVSRQPVDINQLIELGTVYACNAVYRTHQPHVLVATDTPIATAIQESGYAKQHRFYTRRPIKGQGALKVPDRYRGSSSGPIATALASMDGNQTVYMLGFDLAPDISGNFNNVYAGTEFYKKSSAPPTFTGNWQRQLCQVFDDFPTVEFIRVMGKTTAPVQEFKKFNNYRTLPIEEFLAQINTTKDF